MQGIRFHIQVNDNGTATLFATLEKGREAQKTNMEKRAARKAAQRKADKRAEKKEKAEEALASRRDKNRTDAVEDEDTITFSDKALTSEGKYPAFCCFVCLISNIG